MNTPIVFTASELVGAVLALCAGITCISAALNVLAGWIAKAKTPNKTQNERLDQHEAWLKRHDQMLDNDNRRLKDLEKSNVIVMKALLALLQHGIDGNDVEGMRKVKAELESYLIDRQ